jgi:diaminohydroxyphosphoribosylaminopyrimidine deaminase/5-amino-6-(5-phosphoribosylamino)uracil reductase
MSKISEVTELNAFDELCMRRCIQLAMNAPRTTSPNPMVGAIIVYKGHIIGEGYHIRSGEGHAEVNAIHSVKEKSLLKESTIYVSLEPCSHYGKTPPCSKLIIEQQIPRVVIGCVDPFAKVHGQGILMLKNAGIDVTVGVLENECKDLNKKFITSQSKQRPYITLKWAASSDGFIDQEREGGKPVVFSSQHMNMLIHKMRSENDAIFVGTRTALLDNPSLTVRNWYGPNPLRIVIDRKLSLPKTLFLFDKQVETLVYTEEHRDDESKLHYVSLEPEKDLLPQILADLSTRSIRSVLVEGGTQLLQSFIDNDIWDEAFVEKSNIVLKTGVREPQIQGSLKIEQVFGINISHYIRI